MSTTKKLTLDEIVEIAGRALATSQNYQSIDEQLKRLVVFGTTMKKTCAECMAYIPGERPEQGEIIAVFEVDRVTGETREVERSEW